MLIIGDSYFDISDNFRLSLEEHAHMTGALAASEHYRDLSRSGTRLSGNQIPGQYTAGQAATPVKVLVMCGIGNDLLASQGCSAPYSSCATISDALTAAKQLIEKVASDGTVEDIVYTWYPEAQNNAKLLEQENYVRPLLETICKDSTVPCHWVDLRPSFAGKYAQYIMGDGIHPTPAGSKASADAVWAEMMRSCVAQ